MPSLMKTPRPVHPSQLLHLLRLRQAAMCKLLILVIAMPLPRSPDRSREGGSIKDLRSEKGSTGGNGPQIPVSLSDPERLRQLLPTDPKSASREEMWWRPPLICTALEVCSETRLALDLETILLRYLADT